MYIRLLKFLIQATTRVDTTDKRAASRNIGRIIGGTVLVIFMFALFVPISLLLFKAIGPEKSASVLGAFLAAFMVMALIFGLRIGYGLFGPSRDLPFLFSLPIPRMTIFAARMSMGYFSEMLTVFAMVLPVFIGYWIVYGTVSSVMASIIILLLLPALSLSIASLLTLFVLRFARALHVGEGVFVVLNTVVMLVWILGVQFLSQYIGVSAGIGLENNIDQLSDTMARVGGMFPPAMWAANGIVQPFGGSFWLFILICAITVALVCFIGGRIYKHGVQLTTETKRKSKSPQHIQYGRNNVIGAILKKDIRVILRSSTFAMNLISSLIAGPIAIFAMTFSFQAGGSSSAEIFGMEDNLFFYMAFGFIALMASINTVGSTAMSREGRSLWIDLIMPVSPWKQIFAKLLLGQIIGFLESCILIAIMVLGMRMPVGIAVPAGLAGVLASIAPQVISAWPDFLNPKVRWASEREAMKNNFNALVGMLFSFLMFIPHIVVFIVFASSLPLSVVFSMAISAVEIIVIFLVLPKMAKNAFKGWQNAF